MANQEMWGGRFSSSPSEIMKDINQSITFDKRLYKEDINGSIAHANMLAKQKIIEQSEADKIISGLKQIEKEIEDGVFEFKKELEDIHMNIESRLGEIIGDAAGKLHTARSRNDQVATDLKMWIRRHIGIVDDELQALISALSDKAAKHENTVMPGFTHLQAAQPITFAKHLRAYVEMYKRDIGRLEDCKVRLNECPLGSCALNGTTFDIDRAMTAKELGFDKPTESELDSVSDRDFVIEYLSALSICAVHLSRFSEEIILWSSYQFNYIKLSDNYTTGSSMMPQKRNPDGAELARAKSGSIIGTLNSMLIVMKALPLAYSKDMQEDKVPVFNATDTIILLLKVMAGMVADMTINVDKMKQDAYGGYANATYLAEWLVQNLGIPFRKAHHITGQIVKLAEDRNVMLGELSLDEMRSIEPEISKDVYGFIERF